MTKKSLFAKSISKNIEILHNVSIEPLKKMKNGSLSLKKHVTLNVNKPNENFKEESKGEHEQMGNYLDLY